RRRRSTFAAPSTSARVAATAWVPMRTVQPWFMTSPDLLDSGTIQHTPRPSERNSSRPRAPGPRGAPTRPVHLVRRYLGEPPSCQGRAVRQSGHTQVMDPWVGGGGGGCGRPVDASGSPVAPVVGGTTSAHSGDIGDVASHASGGSLGCPEGDSLAP